MLPDDLRRLRLANQHLAHQQLDDPAALVAHLGAVQAQDYPAAKWALGLRLRGATDAAIEQAVADGTILRTHVLRPTWHFVAPADIRWLLRLTGPRIKAAMGSYTRALGLSEDLFVGSQPVIERALAGGRSLTRAELGASLRQTGIAVPDGGMLAHIVSRAELDGLVCSGPPRGSQQTYALLEERVPPAPVLTGDEAIAELTWRYFTSHGPALVQDASWWSGLSVGQVKRGLELNRGRLTCETVDGRAYWLSPTQTQTPPPPATSSPAHLLPNYDEYTVAYRERDLYYDRAAAWTGNPREDVPFRDVILIGGRVVGRWTRPSRQSNGSVQWRWFIEPSPAERRAVEAAAERYARFVVPCRPCA